MAEAPLSWCKSRIPKTSTWNSPAVERPQETGKENPFRGWGVRLPGLGTGSPAL